MCGIAGLFNVRAAFPDPSLRDATLREMAQVQRHRGPDDEGFWHDAAGRCSLAHRRLAIIDTSTAGRQPMLSADARWAIAFNGEIYNFEELRTRLATDGEGFRGRTDTEVLLRVLGRWDLQGLERLDGMFALAAFDRAAGRLLLARDPFGEKPLYYAELAGGGLAFASELQALEKLPHLNLEVSADAIAELLMFQYIGAPRTIYGSIRKLPPGHWLIAEAGRPLRIGRYYAFRPGDDGFDERPLGELADEAEALLTESLRRRLISDVPLGAFLSGGVDSSTVCALIRRRLDVPLKTFSIGFEAAPESEHHTARTFAEHLGSEHHEQVLAPDASNFLSGIGAVLDEPNADSSCLPTYLLSQFARQSVTVALSGDGGDELFGGYGRYFTTVDEARRADGTWDAGAAYYSNRILVSVEKHVEELFGFMPAATAAHLARLRDEISADEGELWSRLRRSDVDNYMPGAVLPKVDRMSMQHSLEVRTPFLNVALARFAGRLPPAMLYDGRYGKRVLREIAYRYLPRKLVDLPKQGFGLPLSAWARTALLKVADNSLRGDDSRVRAMFGPEAVERFLTRQHADGSFSAYQVWALATLESWLRHHPARLPALDTVRRAGPTVARRPTGVRKDAPAAHWLWPLTRDVVLVCRPLPLALDGEETRCGSALTLITELDALLDACSIDLTTVVPPSAAPAPIEWNQLPDRLQGLRDRPAGVTLLLQHGAMLERIGMAELDRLRFAGVRRVAVPHPYRDDGAVFVLDIKAPQTRRQSARDAQRLRALGQRLRGKVHHGDGHLRIAGPLPGIEAAEREDFDRVMIFAGGHQLPPLPTSHEAIRRDGGGRYSIWSGQAFYSSPPRRHLLLSRTLRVVPRTRESEPVLTYVPSIVERSPERELSSFIGALKAFPAADEAVHGRRFAAAPIVVLTHALPPGGAERQWCYLAVDLQRRGLDVHFITTDPLEGDDAHYLPLLNDAGIEVIALDRMDAGNVLDDQPSSPALRRLLAHRGNPFGINLVRLVSVLTRLRPRAIFAQLDSPNLLAGTAAVLTGVPQTILSFRNYNPSRFSYLNNHWYRPMYRALVQWPQITLSGNARAANADYAAWIGVPPERVTLVPNAIDAAQFGAPSAARRQRLRAELSMPADAALLLGVFRLNEEKRPLLFVDICARVAEQVPGLRVALVGVGPLQQAVQERVRALGLGDRIHLLGRRDDAHELMAAADVVLLVSNFEGMPNVLMEAQLMGTPVVAAAVGGVPDCVQDGRTGFLVAAQDTDAFVRRCIELLQDPDLREQFGAAAAESMRRFFSREAMASRYLQLLDAGATSPEVAQRPERIVAAAP